jgi:hypothetical protein
MGGPLPRGVNHASGADLCVGISERMRAADAGCGLSFLLRSLVVVS